ncbi:hypothetical protein [Streptomyces griseoluteus]
MPGGVRALHAVEQREVMPKVVGLLTTALEMRWQVSEHADQ